MSKSEIAENKEDDASRNFSVKFHSLTVTRIARLCSKVFTFTFRLYERSNEWKNKCFHENKESWINFTEPRWNESNRSTV